MPLVAGRQPDGKRLLTPKSSDILKDFSVNNQKTTVRVLVLILELSIKNKRLFIFIVISVTAVTDADDVRGRDSHRSNTNKEKEERRLKDPFFLPSNSTSVSL